MELSKDFNIPTNSTQTPITRELLLSLPEEVAEQLIDITSNIVYVKNLISPNRRRAKDMPKDEKGRIIVDFANPHILEDMDYFRPSALFYKQNGCYTFLRPNPNPNSEFRKWIDEEKRRILEGYVRESDGEWVTGFMYFFLNYCPIMVTDIEEGKKRANRIEDFPEIWEGLYLRFHYIERARENGHHAIELARRGAGKSYSMASMMAHNFILGESMEARRRVTTILTAFQKEYLALKDGTLSKFEPMINFIAENTEFPRLRLANSAQEMFWQSGYVDEFGRKKGSLNSVMGVSSKDDSGKLRGKRGHIYFEEMGSFPNLLEIFDVVRQGMEEGEFTYGLAYMIGTAAEKESNFESAKTLLYHTEGYNIQSIPNVYDRPRQGSATFGYFFPGYMNRKGCYNKDGVSDVVKALIQILKRRYKDKYSADPNTVLRTIAELPITPAEAIVKVKDAFFPVTALTERANQLDSDPHAYDDIYIGRLVLSSDNKVKWEQSNDVPIRQYKVDNDTVGALEIYEMPEKDGKEVFADRYILGLDPVNNDQADSTSLMSVFVFDLWTDRIVAEYTGRQKFADDGYEITRLLCLFYNGRCLYESNIKGPYAYFKQMDSLHLLADTPQYLRDKQIIKYSAFGMNSKGVAATAAINNYANQRIRDWLLKPVPIVTKDDDGNEIETTSANLNTIRSRALLAELIEFDPVRNFDRVRALGMVMLYREEKVILYGAGMKKREEENKDYLGNDDYFRRNYDRFNNPPLPA